MNIGIQWGNFFVHYLVTDGHERLFLICISEKGNVKLYAYILENYKICE